MQIIKNFLNKLKSTRGYLMIMIVVFIPLVFNLLYLFIHAYSQKEDENHQDTVDLANKQSALYAAKYYIASGGTSGTVIPGLEGQKHFVERKACFTFNDIMRIKLGLTENIIPMEEGKYFYKKTIESTLNQIDTQPIYTQINAGYSGSSLSWDTSTFFKRSDIYSSYTSSTLFDPEYKIIEKFDYSSSAWYKYERNITAGTYSYTFLKQASSNSENKLTITKDSSDSQVLKVSSQVVITNNKQKKISYTSSNRVRVGICKADIIIAIPTNANACRKDNLLTNTFNDANFASTPLHQIKNASILFVKKLMFKDGISFGVVPYSGKVSLLSSASSSIIQYLPATTESTFLNSSTSNGYAEKQAAVNIHETLNAFASFGASAFTSNNSTSYSNLGTVVGIIYRGLDNLFSTDYPTITKFYRQPWRICYGGDASLYTGRCKKPSIFAPNPYAIKSLTKDSLSIIRYLQSLEPFNDVRNYSNFLFLPIYLSGLLLKNNFTSSNYNASNKKVLILIANNDDVFAPGELTYLGFNNDASYTSMSDGDSLFFNSGESLTKTGSSYHNKIPNNIYKQYITNSMIKTSYDGSSSDGSFSLIYPKQQNVMFVVTTTVHPWVYIYKENGHNYTKVSYTYLDQKKEITNGEQVTLKFTSEQKHTVLAKLVCAPGVRVTTTNTKVEFRREPKNDIGYVIYICKKTTKALTSTNITENDNNTVGTSGSVVLTFTYNTPNTYERLAYINGVLLYKNQRINLFLDSQANKIVDYNEAKFTAGAPILVNNSHNAVTYTKGRARYIEAYKKSIVETLSYSLRRVCSATHLCNARACCETLSSTPSYTKTFTNSYADSNWIAKFSDITTSISYRRASTSDDLKGVNGGGSREHLSQSPPEVIYSITLNGSSIGSGKFTPTSSDPPTGNYTTKTKALSLSGIFDKITVTTANSTYTDSPCKEACYVNLGYCTITMLQYTIEYTKTRLSACFEIPENNQYWPATNGATTIEADLYGPLDPVDTRTISSNSAFSGSDCPTGISSGVGTIYRRYNGTGGDFHSGYAVYNLLTTSDLCIYSVYATIPNSTSDCGVEPSLEKSEIKIGSNTFTLTPTDDKKCIFIDKSELTNSTTLNFTLTKAIVEEIHWSNLLKNVATYSGLSHFDAPLTKRSLHCKKYSGTSTIGGLTVSGLTTSGSFKTGKIFNIKPSSAHTGDLSLLVYNHNKKQSNMLAKTFKSGEFITSDFKEEFADYPVNGLTNIFVPLKSKYTTIPIEFDDTVTILQAEVTNPVNYVLHKKYGLTAETSGNMTSSNEITLRDKVTPYAINTFKNLAPNSRIYLIKYKVSAAVSTNLNKITTYKTYNANNEAELNSTLTDIAKDIETFAEAEEPAIIE